VLRRLAACDAPALFEFFESLGPASKRRFQPHPLTSEAARDLCVSSPSSTLRWVVAEHGVIVAYFILDAQVSPHEVGRYRDHGIELEAGKDFMFAPAVTDRLQNEGMASEAMPHLLALARAAGARSLVLMGGTQATNPRAIAFYEKFSFKRCGGYQTEVFNHDMRRMIDADPPTPEGA
jgi:GNAT superfamily N-acetyltransferase